jgi:hypothetical protein
MIKKVDTILIDDTNGEDVMNYEVIIKNSIKDKGIFMLCTVNPLELVSFVFDDNWNIQNIGTLNLGSYFGNFLGRDNDEIAKIYFYHISLKNN